MLYIRATRTDRNEVVCQCSDGDALRFGTLVLPYNEYTNFHNILAFGGNQSTYDLQERDFDKW